MRDSMEFVSKTRITGSTSSLFLNLLFLDLSIILMLLLKDQNTHCLKISKINSNF